MMLSFEKVLGSKAGAIELDVNILSDFLFVALRY